LCVRQKVKTSTWAHRMLYSPLKTLCTSNRYHGYRWPIGRFLFQPVVTSFPTTTK
jgi:hypothetical protein